MAYYFPLAASDFFEGLKISNMSCDLVQPQSASRSRGGVGLSASTEDEYWAGSVTLRVSGRRARDPVRAVTEIASRAGASFLAYDASRNGPLADKGGAALAGYTPQIKSVNTTNNLELVIKGLPSGYKLTKNDLMGWQSGASPLRYYHYRIARDVVASAGGEATVEVTAFIKGAVANASVDLVRPVFKAIMEAPSYGVHSPGLTSGTTFNFKQTFGW